MSRVQTFSRWGLYLMAFSSLLATAPAHLGAALAAPGALAALARRRPAWDAVTGLTLAVAAWLLIRYGLQMAGQGEPGLLKPGAVLADWLFPLLFLPFAWLTGEDRLGHLARLWLLALLGCTVGVASFLASRGVAVLWSGERLGYHFSRPLGIGLYAGCFVVILLGTWRFWWQAAAPWRWPARILGVAALALYTEVLITAQNRSTYLALLGGLAALGIGAWRLLRGRGDASDTLSGRKKVLVAVVAASLIAGLAWLNRGVIERRLGAEREVVTAIDTQGLEAAPASSISVRLRLWRFALESFPEAPLIGHGFGSLVDVINARVGATEAMLPGERYDHLHNTYLQLLWSQGLVGVLLWGALGVALLRAVGRAARHDDRVRALTPAVAGGVTFVALWGCFDYRLSHVDTRMFALLTLMTLRQLGMPRESGGSGEEA